jgi:hypothetical protein
VEAIVMSLVFDHSLRIRLKAETDAKSASAPVSVANSALGSPKASDTLVKDSGSGDEGDSDTVHSRSATAVSTTTAATTSTIIPPASAQTTAADTKNAISITEPKEKQEKKSNLVGKINNLMTSDLANITRGRDFLFIGAIFSTLCAHCALLIISLRSIISTIARCAWNVVFIRGSRLEVSYRTS